MSKNNTAATRLRQLLPELMARHVSDCKGFKTLTTDIQKILPRVSAGAPFGLGRDADERDYPLKKSEIVLSTDLRPIVWHDLLAFKTQFDRTNPDVVTDFGFSAVNYCAPKMETSTSGLLTMQRSYDILYRIYFTNPGPYPWERLNFIDAFEQIYGGIIETFGSTEYAHTDSPRREVARRAFQFRFGEIFGMSSSTTYRWFDSTCRPTQHQYALLRKVCSLPSPVAALETIATLSAALRGVDLNKRAPIPMSESAESSQAFPIPRVVRRRSQEAPAAVYAGGSFG